MRTAVRLAIAAAVFALPLAANAQPAAPVPEPARDGFLIGFGLGGGHVEIDCTECGDVIEAGSFDVHIGAMLQPNFALMFDLWTMVHEEDFLTASQTIATGAIQFWLIPKLWIKGGLGVAEARWRWDGIFVNFRDRTERVPGIMFGAGYEVYDSGNFALDVQFRAGTGFYSNDGDDDDYEVTAKNAAIQLGFNWY